METSEQIEHEADQWLFVRTSDPERARQFFGAPEGTEVAFDEVSGCYKVKAGFAAGATFTVDAAKPGDICCYLSRMIRDHRYPARVVRLTKTQIIVEWWNKRNIRHETRFYRKSGKRVGEVGSMYATYVVPRTPGEFKEWPPADAGTTS